MRSDHGIAGAVSFSDSQFLSERKPRFVIGKHMESLDDNDGDLTRVKRQPYRGLGHVDGAIQQTLPAFPLRSHNLWSVGCPGCEYCRCAYAWARGREIRQGRSRSKRVRLRREIRP